MQCTSPVNLEPEKGMYGLIVPCGSCTACRISRAREWATRIMHETESHASSTFVTLTFNDENLPPDYGLNKETLRLYMKRLRERVSPRKLKWFACGEYGHDGARLINPHYHAIIFGVHALKDGDILRECWNINGIERGFVHLGTVTYNSARYCAEYVMKGQDYDMIDELQIEKPFSIKSPGLGKEYALQNRFYLEEYLQCHANGHVTNLPRYYVKLLDIDEQRLKEKAQKKKQEEARQWRLKGIAGVRKKIAELEWNSQRERNLVAKEKLREKKL